MSSDTLATSAPPAAPEQPLDAALPIVLRRRRRHGRLLGAGRLSTDPLLRSVPVRLFRAIPILVRLAMQWPALRPAEGAVR